jgi:hypothetical protein
MLLLFRVVRPVITTYLLAGNEVHETLSQQLHDNSLGLTQEVEKSVGLGVM